MFSSAKMRLTLWYAGVLAISLTLFASLIYFLLVRALNERSNQSLRDIATAFTTTANREIDSADDESQDERNNVAIEDAAAEFSFRNYQAFVFDTSEDLLASTKTTTTEHNLSSRQGVEVLRKKAVNSTQFAQISESEDSFRVLVEPFNLTGKKYFLVVGHSIEEEVELLSQVRAELFVSVPFVLLLTSLGGYFLAKKSLSPIGEMAAKAETITARNLGERLPVKKENDELGMLANRFNELLSRLDLSFEQQKRFMADASHELRTPLAIIRGESEIALSKERTNKDLRESLAIVQDESKRLTKIVEELFLLSRADAEQFKTNFRQVYLDEILSDCGRSVRVLAEKKRISLEFSTKETQISGDEQLLRRLFLNLLDNAVKYNREGGKVSVNLANNTVTVLDTGLGIADSDKTKIFERFYRADKSRSRIEESPTSGAGLGLSIAKWIAELHHADLKLSKSDESGSQFTVKFPVEK